jgi:hypothetical protein
MSRDLPRPLSRRLSGFPTPLTLDSALEGDLSEDQGDTDACVSTPGPRLVPKLRDAGKAG